MMKDYEIFSSLKTPKNSKIIIRLDGRSFHNFARDMELIKPYDEEFYNVLAKVCHDLFKEFSPLFIYTFSDEINILLDNIPFNRRIEKLDSVIASFTSSAFTIHYNKPFKKPVAFDSRIIPISDCDIFNYFKWRQDEAWRNCINSYGIYFLKSKYNSAVANEKIYGLKINDIHELLFQNGININNVEIWKKRGISVYKKQKKIEGFNIKKNKTQVSYRDYIYTNWHTPIFSKEFFEEVIK